MFIEGENMSKVIGIVPAEKDKVLVSNGRNRLVKTTKLVEFLSAIESRQQQVIGFMGGPSSEVFAEAHGLGFPVHLVPFFKAQTVVQWNPKESPEVRLKNLLDVWQKKSDLFYPFRPFDETIDQIRTLTRVRLGIQEFRKKSQLKLYAALKRMRFFLPAEHQELCELMITLAKKMYRNKELQKQVENGLNQLELKLPKEKCERIMRTMRHFANPRFIIETKRDEEEQEDQITILLKDVPLYQALVDRSAPWRVMGFGPALGGSVISEMGGNTLRFPHPGALRAYFRQHLVAGQFPVRKKGQESNWNPYASRAIHWWGKDQLHRWKNSIWIDYYLWQKAWQFRHHAELVPKEVTDRRGRKKIIQLYTLKHLDSRARRWCCSKLLEWTFTVGHCLENNIDPKDQWNKAWPSAIAVAEFLRDSLWYSKSWAENTDRIKGELDGGLREFVKEEVVKRKKNDPEPETEEEDDSSESND